MIKMLSKLFVVFRIRKLCSWKIRDYVTFYSTSRTYLFQDIHDSKDVYYSVEDSLIHVSNFLLNSFGDDIDNFLQTLVNVIDRRIPKKILLKYVPHHLLAKHGFLT